MVKKVPKYWYKIKLPIADCEVYRVGNGTICTEAKLVSLGPKFGPRVSTCEPWPPNVRLCSDRPAPPSGQWLINKARPSADPHNSSNQLSMASSITGHCCNYSLDCRPCHRQCWYFIGPPGAGQLRRLYRYIYYIYLYTEYWFYYSWLGLQKVNVTPIPSFYQVFIKKSDDTGETFRQDTWT